MKILILGSTGFIGKNLCKELLSSGHNVVVFTSNHAKAQSLFGKNVEITEWIGYTPFMPSSTLQNVSAVINLAGESIGTHRWTKSVKEKIVQSRMKTTQAVVNAIKDNILSPKILVNASAVGFYGPRNDEEVTESSPAGGGFLAEVCKAWESEAYKAESYGTQVVTVRIGVVLGNEGALVRMMIPFQYYIGGPIGTGNQWLSWIHIHDLVKIFKFIIEKGTVSGSVNATAPQPVRMKDFCEILGKVMSRPSWVRVPEFVLKIALGEMADMLFNGQRVLPKKMIDAGFEFRFPTLHKALEEIIQRKKIG
ncbi:MAG: TIGR01777 family oxidoreductase [Nitrospirota bacterium]|nr:TIGR01777 family oxidoreductase [Nitrospirota bacterium]MDH5768793.1 TIGR01777 family oxidoreductase [Nitrospirota bacterium]